MDADPLVPVEMRGMLLCSLLVDSHFWGMEFFVFIWFVCLFVFIAAFHAVIKSCQKPFFHHLAIFPSWEKFTFVLL